ncbi:MAG TPA: hypothetical protein VGD26_02210 [Chitinophagaceae bacterium]
MKERENRQQDNANERNSQNAPSPRDDKQDVNYHPDFSRMDKREGNLEHGEIGGGFRTIEDEEKNKE